MERNGNVKGSERDEQGDAGWRTCCHAQNENSDLEFSWTDKGSHSAAHTIHVLSFNYVGMSNRRLRLIGSLAELCLAWSSPGSTFVVVSSLLSGSLAVTCGSFFF